MRLITYLKSHNLSRRAFLSLISKLLVAISTILGLNAVARYFSFNSTSARPVLFDLGPETSMPQDAIIQISEAQAIIVPTEEGFMAYSLECPHLGCLIEIVDDGFWCPCHGSTFKIDGTVTKGPADRNLRRLMLQKTEDGHLLLDNSEN